jgi:hypothetical protein
MKKGDYIKWDNSTTGIVWDGKMWRRFECIICARRQGVAIRQVRRVDSNQEITTQPPYKCFSRGHRCHMSDTPKLVRAVSDAEIRKAVEADVQRYFATIWTGDVAGKRPEPQPLCIDNTKALITKLINEHND